MHKHVIQLASQLLYRTVFAAQLEEAEFKYGGKVLRDLSRRLEKALTGEFKAFMSEHNECLFPFCHNMRVEDTKWCADHQRAKYAAGGVWIDDFDAYVSAFYEEPKHEATP